MRYGTTSHSIHSVQFSEHFFLFLYYRQFVVVLVICRCRMQKSTTLATHVVHQMQRTIGGAEAGAGTVIGSTAIGEERQLRFTVKSLIQTAVSQRRPDLDQLPLTERCAWSRGVIWQEWPEDTAVIVFVTREGLPQVVGRVPTRPEDGGKQ